MSQLAVPSVANAYIGNGGLCWARIAAGREMDQVLWGTLSIKKGTLAKGAKAQASLNPRVKIRVIIINIA